MQTRSVTTFGFGISPALSANATLRTLSAGENIFVEGDRAGELIGVVTGRVKLWRLFPDGTACTLLALGPGELIGSVAVAQTTPHLTSATAMSSVDLECWSAALFREELRKSAALSAEFLQQVARRATQLIDRFEDVAALPVEARLARAIIRLVGDFGMHDDALAVVLDVRQQDLAEMALSTVPTVSRVLTGWKGAGIVLGGRGRLTIPHLSRLAILAGLHLD